MRPRREIRSRRSILMHASGGGRVFDRMIRRSLSLSNATLAPLALAGVLGAAIHCNQSDDASPTSQTLDAGEAGTVVEDDDGGAAQGDGGTKVTKSDGGTIDSGTPPGPITVCAAGDKSATSVRAGGASFVTANASCSAGVRPT